MEEIARKNGALEVRVAKDDAEANKLATARRSAFSALARVAPTTILEDATVPRSELARMIRFVEAIAKKKYKLRIGTFGHMGDGNLHPTFLTDERNKAEMHRIEEAFHEIFEEAIRLGGTITGEHGVGLARNTLRIRRQRPDARDARAAKGARPERHLESREDVRLSRRLVARKHMDPHKPTKDERDFVRVVQAGTALGLGLMAAFLFAQAGSPDHPLEFTVGTVLAFLVTAAFSWLFCSILFKGEFNEGDTAQSAAIKKRQWRAGPFSSSSWRA